ncbi:peptide transporter [Sphingomonas sp. Root710]|uniref:OPT family oligopeptide transporter n=1 Tax=Sphingomonas sp. Root710 TaxID=1736594 RepID=UPI0006F632CF|nr:oligopeptide transporter, OPT family [Sphingomonas sp. Root710]KRB83135.1 peptide transporter [Sphingomonas sp. Root710]
MRGEGALTKAGPSYPQFTVRGIVLGCVMTFLFTAANLSLGLRIGLTFATSIPAAVISMAALRAFRTSNILESNIVQTITSSAGALSAIGFVLPGLIMVGWWQDFSFWPTFWICTTGGLLGVLFSGPLRRALVIGSNLPYPEGVAAAEVLKVGSNESRGSEESRAGLRTIIVGAIAAAAYSALAATQLAAAGVTKWFRIGPYGSVVDVTLQFALIGAGHLVGLSIGIALLVGLLIGFGIVTPYLAWLLATPAAAEAVWLSHVRFFGAGVIGVAAIWTLLQLMLPIGKGLRDSLASSRERKRGGLSLTVAERDLPIGWLGIGLIAVTIPTAMLFWNFLISGPLSVYAAALTIGALGYVLLAGPIVAAVCGYMAGLIGSSNSPISGVGILAIVGAALLLAVFVQPNLPSGAHAQLVAFAIFATSIIYSTASIANDNLQDLKTGQLVGATPWKQQVALMIGVIAAALVTPFTLDLLNKAYGFAPLSGITPPHALAAPQATLVSALSTGILGVGLDWSMIGAGAGLGVLLIAADTALSRKGRPGCPPLAVGLGIYLPMGATLPLIIGGLLGHLYERRAKSQATKRMGVLLASGFIVGDGLFNVGLAGLIVASGKAAPLALAGDDFGTSAVAVGLVLFAGMTVLLYRRTLRVAAGLPGTGTSKSGISGAPQNKDD